MDHFQGYIPMRMSTFWKRLILLGKMASFLTKKRCFTRDFRRCWFLSLETPNLRLWVEACFMRVFGRVFPDLNETNSWVEDWLNLFWGSLKLPRNPGPSSAERNSPPVLFPPGFWCLPPVGFSPHTPYPSIAGEALPWTKSLNYPFRGWMTFFFTYWDCFSITKWPTPFRCGNFKRQLGFKTP